MCASMHNKMPAGLTIDDDASSGDVVCVALRRFCSAVHAVAVVMTALPPPHLAYMPETCLPIII
jgi:hypothetical protein